MAGIVGTHLVAQVGFIVKDVEAAKKKWIGAYETTQTVYQGQPAPEAYCWMAFFDVGPGLQLELIQPNDKPSTWRSFLDEHGEGIHHVAFQVRDSKACVARAEAAGLKLVQHGVYGDGSGEYNYLDAPDLKCVVELLESYNR